MAIPRECKRLAEVDFPIAEVSRHAAREKSIRHGHPSTLHLWWARRPLASSRAVLLGLLWPDPCDPLCPEGFKQKARELLPQVQGTVGTGDAELRKALLKFIADFANWHLAVNRNYLEVSRALVKAAHGEEPPLVVDPFAGGGSIPLEALRLGCEAFASDLNPVACLILKVMLEDIPRHGPKLAEELRRVGTEIKGQAEKELAEFYPKDPHGASPIAYLWARTVRCESPNCGAEIPLVRSFWLCTKASRRRALRYKVVRSNGEPPRVEFSIFVPKTEGEVQTGSVARSNATCLCCGLVLPRVRVQAQQVQVGGGADTARILAVVTRNQTGEKSYREPIASDRDALRVATDRLAELEATNAARYRLDEELPYLRSIFNVRVYGIDTWGKLYTRRQRLALLSIGDAISRADLPATVEGSHLRTLLALVVSRMADYMTTICRWDLGQERANHTFGRQALGMIWDYAEIVPFSHTVGSWDSMLNSVIKACEGLQRGIASSGTVAQGSATVSRVPDGSAAVVFTDPPYYDAVPYANLSDFFVVWLTRMLGEDKLPGLVAGLAPKDEEIVQLAERNPLYKHKTKQFFETQMTIAFAQARRALSENGIGSVVFAHKDTDSWEALIGALLAAGWECVASWPLKTEQAQRLRARDSAALASSVHLVCRPRPEDAGVGDWADVLRELPNRVGDWMERLQGEGVRGADLVFACIGPALEIFSRYARVETADGREVTLPEYLEKVWEVVGRSALSQVLGTAEAKVRNGAAGAVEEDARLTALFLWTLQSTNVEAAAEDREEGEDEEASVEDDDEEDSSSGKVKGFTLVFDVVRRFAQPLGIELPKWEGRVIETKKGVVRLLPIAERAKQLFGEDGAQAVAARLEREATTTNPLQRMLFPDLQPGAAPAIRGRGRGHGKRVGGEASDESLAAAREATTLDRVHAAMLLQAGGRTNALRALLKAEQQRGPDFLRLANALSALYPKGSEEKRLLDAMLLAVPR
jgi:putative DNA methylase